MSETRKATNTILEMIDEGLLSATSVVTMCLKWMSEDDVAAMAEANELFEDFEDDEDEEASNPYVINVGDSRFNMYPLESASTEEVARARVDELLDSYKCVEAVYMPEDNDDINEVIYSWYTD